MTSLVEHIVTDKNGIRDRTEVRVRIEQDLQSTTAPLAVLDDLAKGGTGNIADASGDQNIPVIDDGGNVNIRNYILGSMGELPVRNLATLQSHANVLNPIKDTLRVTRVTVTMTVAATPGIAAASVVAPQSSAVFATTPVANAVSAPDRQDDLFLGRPASVLT